MGVLSYRFVFWVGVLSYCSLTSISDNSFLTCKVLVLPSSQHIIILTIGCILREYIKNLLMPFLSIAHVGKLPNQSCLVSDNKCNFG